MAQSLCAPNSTQNVPPENRPGAGQASGTHMMKFPPCFLTDCTNSYSLLFASFLEVIKKYSNFVGVPIYLNGKKVNAIQVCVNMPSNLGLVIVVEWGVCLCRGPSDLFPLKARRDMQTAHIKSLQYNSWSTNTKTNERHVKIHALCSLPTMYPCGKNTRIA